MNTDQNPYAPLETSDVEDVSGWIVDFGSAALLLVAASGVAFWLVGAVPMLSALVVDSRTVDDGIDPGDRELMAKWDSWAFTYRHFTFVICGMVLVLMTLPVLLRSRRPMHY